LDRIKDPAPAAVVGYGSETDDDIEMPFTASSQQLAAELRAHGVKVQLIALPRQTHIQTAMSLGDPASALAQSVVGLVTRTP
jgi:hypothetical protein